MSTSWRCTARPTSGGCGSADQHRALLDQFAGHAVAQPLARYQSLFDEFEAVRAELARLREAGA